MGCGAAATSLDFIFVINPRVFSANRVDFGFFVSKNFQCYPSFYLCLPAMMVSGVLNHRPHDADKFGTIHL